MAHDMLVEIQTNHTTCLQKGMPKGKYMVVIVLVTQEDLVKAFKGDTKN